MENTLQIFVLAATLHIFKYSKEKLILNTIIAGIFLFFGFLSKGFVAFFPIVLPFLFLIFFSNYKFDKFIKQSSILIISIVLLVFLMFFIFPDSITYFKKYFDKQIISSLKLKSGFHGHFYIVKLFFNQILPSLGFLLIIFIYSRIKKLKFNFDKSQSNLIYVLLIVILSGFLPFMLSVKQRAFYLIPVLPFVAIFTSLIIDRQMLDFEIIDKLAQNKIFKLVSLSLLATSFVIIVFSIGKIGRDKQKINDVYKICNLVPANSVIDVKEISLTKDYSLMAYLARTKRIGLMLTNEPNTNYLLTDKNYTKIPKNYIKKDLHLSKYCLYMKTK